MIIVQDFRTSRQGPAKSFFRRLERERAGTTSGKQQCFPKKLQSGMV